MFFKINYLEIEKSINTCIATTLLEDLLLKEGWSTSKCGIKNIYFLTFWTVESFCYFFMLVLPSSDIRSDVDVDQVNEINKIDCWFKYLILIAFLGHTFCVLTHWTLIKKARSIKPLLIPLICLYCIKASWQLYSIIFCCRHYWSDLIWNSIVMVKKIYCAHFVTFRCTRMCVHRKVTKCAQ